MFAFAQVALTRLVRDRTNVFFIVLFPLLLVLLIGMQFSGGDRVRIGIVDGAHGEVRTHLLAADVEVELVELGDEAAARGAVEDGDVDAAVLLPPEPAAVTTTDTVEVTFIGSPDASDMASRSLVAAAVAAVDAPLRAQRALLATGTLDDPALATDLVLSTPVSGPQVSSTTVGEAGLAAEFEGLGQFDLGASTQLLLFVFITAMSGSAAVVQARRWGILDRVMAGPTAPSTVVAGLGLGQLAVAGIQALVIVAATSLLFGVDWGDPVASAAVVVVFSMVAAAAGLLLGAVLRNEEQVGGIAVPVSLGLAAIGGSMVPLELFPTTLRQVAHLTPHAWGNLAFAEIVRRDGTLTDVLPQLGVLSGYALVLGAFAAFVLGRKLAVDG